MGCCALGTCTDPDCYLCTVVAKLPQQEIRDRDAKYAEPVTRARPSRDPAKIKRTRKAIAPVVWRKKP